MGFMSSYFTCIAHLYLYYTLFVPHTYASYIRHWCIFSRYEIQYKSFSISNMVSEPLFWHFLSNLFFISVTSVFFFSTSLLPSQQPPQPFAVEPPMSPNRRPWVPDLQPPSLRGFTLHRPLPFASPLQTLLRLRFWRYHRDRLVPIYKLVKASMPSETAYAPMHHLFRSHASTRCHAPPRIPTCSHMLANVIHVSPYLHRCWRHLLALAADVILWLWVFDRWLLKVDRWLWPCVDFDHWLFSKVDFFSPGSSYPIFA